MKGLHNLLRRIKQSLAPRQGKKGSSLAFVMAIGAALVIWVMCIMPMMSTTGTIAYKTEANLLDYLQNRSAIEFCKSELEYIVRSELPSTFAVMVDSNGKYTAVYKKFEYDATPDDGWSTYSSYVNSSDVPTSNDVAAVCVVESPAGVAYSIVITTYNNCEKGIQYTATFTPSGSLKIHPEAYNDGEALPLSDFVLVDGKLGANKVWSSSINMGNATSLGFYESMLGLKTADKLASLPNHANSGEYPAVFKTTAHTASSTSEDTQIAEPVNMGKLSNQETWYEPSATTEDSTHKKIWYTVETDGTVKVWMKTTVGDEDITSDCTVYFNGIPSTTKPTKTGTYQVTIDYSGTDYSSDENPSKYDENKINVLPVAGLKLGSVPVQNTAATHTIDNTYSVKKIERVPVYDASGKDTGDYTFTVTLGYGNIGEMLCDEGLLYGCVNNNNKNVVSWQRSNVFELLNKDDTYFFYVCRPASFDPTTGIFKAASSVNSAGMVFPVKYVTELHNQSQYAISSEHGDILYQYENNFVTADIYSNPGGEYGYIGTQQDLNAFTWTSILTNGSWNFVYEGNNLNQKLTISGEAKGNFDYEIRSHQHKKHNPGKTKQCLYATYTGYQFTDVKTTISGGSEFAVKYIEDYNFQVFTDVKYRIKWNPYIECHVNYNGNNDTEYKDVSQKFYLDLIAPTAYTSDTEKNVRFIQIPTPPASVASPSPDHNLINNTIQYNPKGVFLSFNNTPNIVAVYANGEKITWLEEGYNLNVGTYNIIVEAKVGDRTYFSNAGVLTVTKASLDGNITVTTTPNAKDHLVIDVSATGWHANGGYRYFGYREITKDNRGNEVKGAYRWFSTLDISYGFRLPYGTYEFAVRETGSNNYSSSAVFPTDGVRCSVDYPEIELVVGRDEWKFQFTLDNDMKPTWYKAPENIYPDETVQFMYAYEKRGSISGSTETVWYKDYQGQSFDLKVFGIGYVYTFLNTYGVQVKNSNFEWAGDSDIDWTNGAVTKPVFPIGGKYTYEELNGHAPSMMRGSSLYFMGNPSINTHGNVVQLTTDLLVLNGPITNGGVEDDNSEVIVNSYSGKTSFLLYTTKDILNSEGTTIFAAKKFYVVPSGADIYDMTTSMIGTTAELGDVTSEAVKLKFRTKEYPTIIMDIANASRQQLSRIISSETIGWTVDGKLSGSDSSSNAGYCVPVYVTNIAGSVSYKANRILVAAGKEASYTLTVPANLTFTTRYLSLDAAQVNQGASEVKFTLKNLAQDINFIQAISSALGITNSYSKTLQMDYERSTLITSENGSAQLSAQICRYSEDQDKVLGPNGEKDIDLFEFPDSAPLMATYTTSEIERLFTGGLSGLAKTVKTVDRYVSVVPSGSNNSIDLSSLLSVNLDIYANYVYFSPDVTSINLSSFLNSDITVNTQESGYTEHEYLGLFKTYSADSYSGIILYFHNDVTITYSNRPNVEIPKGFYYVEAKSNGMAFSNFHSVAIPLTIQQLRDLSIYIDPNTGAFSDSYVDTGLDDNESAGLGGFSGGTMG